MVDDPDVVMVSFKIECLFEFGKNMFSLCSKRFELLEWVGMEANMKNKKFPYLGARSPKARDVICCNH